MKDPVSIFGRWRGFSIWGPAKRWVCLRIGNGSDATPLMRMNKTSKALDKQAAKSQLAAQRAGSPLVVEQMTSLAAAFRAQAAVLKKKNKNKKKK
jgi:hypothetical protein